MQTAVAKIITLVERRSLGQIASQIPWNGILGVIFTPVILIYASVVFVLLLRDFEMNSS